LHDTCNIISIPGIIVYGKQKKPESCGSNIYIFIMRHFHFISRSKILEMRGAMFRTRLFKIIAQLRQLHATLSDIP